MPNPEKEGEYFLIHRFYLRKERFCTIWLTEEDYSQWGIYKNVLIKNGIFFKVLGVDAHQINSHSKFIVYTNSARLLKDGNFKVINGFDSQGLLQSVVKNKIQSFKENMYRWWTEGFVQSIPEKFRITDWRRIDSNSNDNDVYNVGTALFDNHNSHFKDRVSASSVDSIMALYKRAGYYETDSSVYNNQKILESVKDGSTLKWELLEVLNTRVVLFDERIQNYLCANELVLDSDVTISLAKLFSLKNIFIPQKNLMNNDRDDEGEYLDLYQFFYSKVEEGEEAEGYSADINDLVKYLKYYFEDYCCHYIVLHFSGFETLVNNSTALLETLKLGNEALDGDYLNMAYEYVVSKCNISDSGKYLIFTSGKGIPTTLPDKCYFIAYNNIETVIKRKVKFDLVKILNGVRLTRRKM